MRPELVIVNASPGSSLNGFKILLRPIDGSETELALRRDFETSISFAMSYFTTNDLEDQHYELRVDCTIL
jgi:hypothetical protein